MNDLTPFKTRNIFTLKISNEKITDVDFHLSEIYLACRDMGYRFLGDDKWVLLKGENSEKIEFKDIEEGFKRQFVDYVRLYHKGIVEDAILNKFFGSTPNIKKNYAIMEILKPY